ncbi:serine hydrolase [Candidatus Palauibacter sp.]|uniref:serine hydrolase n=1 Tax=Candidatus Palauibacter sp. TaxID=3101350 RepID=UPI003AF2FE4D
MDTLLDTLPNTAPGRHRRRSSVPALVAVLPLFLGVLGVGEVSAQSTELQRGRTVPATLAAGDTVRYTIEADEDDFVLGEVNQISVDVTMRVLDPDGTQIGRFGGLGRGIERFGGRTPRAGTHTLELFVADDEADEAGRYEITLLRHEPVATDPRRLADQIMSRFDGEDSPGGAVRVWRDGKTLYSKTYGMANLAYGIPFEPDTRTNIGSTSKQFTAFAIMLQAERGLLSLDGDIRTHIPELPKFDETIQVRHLITHTSGLREFLNLLRMTGRRLDHGDWIDRSELIDIVQRQPALQNAPGAEWNYNNTAFGLAAAIVERTSGQDFHVFMRENVFGPLGMTGTMVRPSTRHIVPNMSEGYTPGPDGYRQIGDLGGAVGAGSIYTTIADLQTWVENYANPRVGTRESIDEMMTSFVLTDGEETGYGYGLSVDEQGGLKRVSHGGADVAHRSMLVYFPEINAGLTTQSNHAQFNSGVAYELAAAFFKDAMETDEEDEEDGAGAAGEFDPQDYDAEDFDEFTGRYALDAAPNFILTFTREDETLYTQATGQQRLEIVPTSDSTFRLLAVEASVTFLRDEEGSVAGATLHQNGDQHATRLEGDAAEAWAPTPGDLADFAGRFFSEELETFYTFTVQDEELVMHQRRLDQASLTPGEEDNFSGGDMSFAFERDRNGQVIGLYLSNGRTRDVRFARVP